MRRVDGFLDLSNEEKVRNFGYYGVVLLIDGKQYFYKPSNMPYHEVICSELAKVLGVNCVQYDLAYYDFDGRKGVVSESYKKADAKYINGSKVLEKFYYKDRKFLNEMGLNKFEWEKDYEGPNYYHMNNLEIIWPCLDTLYKDYPKEQRQKCLIDLIMQFIFMILTAQYDRGSYQWELEVTKDTISVVPMFDNEASLSAVDVWTGMSTNFNDFHGEPAEVLEEFLSISSREFIDLFLEKYNILTEEKFIEILNLVEQKIQCEIPIEVKAEVIAGFVINRKKLEKVLQKLNIDNNIGR